MKPENAIEVNNITKKFKVYLDKGHTLKEKALFRKRREYEERHVLNGISFAVKKGEAVGLIGHNGCGKSTTLKLLTKIMYPDSGTIEMDGRVSCLLELGAGFHPDMSGRENIYINASIFGLTKKEIDQRVGEIIAFSELEEFIDNPVRTYSSGMYMRLAFAVAIHVDADILLIDEILAVGDAYFQSKCFHRLREIKQGGATIVLVSHSLDQIEKICDRTVWLHEGLLRETGRPKDVHLSYMDYTLEKTEAKKKDQDQNQNQNQNQGQGDGAAATGYKEIGNRKAVFEYARLLDAHMESEKKEIHAGDTVVLEAGYARNDRQVAEAEIGIWIVRDDGVCCVGTNTQADEVENIQLKDKGRIRVTFHGLPLAMGRYSFTLTLRNYADEIYHRIYEAAGFSVKSDKREFGVFCVPHQWEFDGHGAGSAGAGECLEAGKTDVRIVAQEKECHIREKEGLECLVSIANHGQEICPDRFCPVSLSYHLYNENGELQCFEGKRTYLDGKIGRDETRDIQVGIETAGLAAGAYYADIMLVQENVAWFGDMDQGMKERVAIIITQDGPA